LALARLGRHAEALAAIEEAVRLRDGFITEQLDHRLFLPLHDEPRFIDNGCRRGPLTRPLLRYNHLALCAPFLRVTDGHRDLAQRVSRIDHECHLHIGMGRTGAQVGGISLKAGTGDAMP
jgi:hypothetical protein